MQKSTKKASILIWALFLSTFIAFMFLSIAGSVSKNLSAASDFFDRLDELLFFSKVRENPDTYTSGIQNTDQYVKNESGIFSLTSDSAMEIRFQGSASATITISVQEGGPLYYGFVRVDDDAGLDGLTSSGVVSSNSSFLSGMDTSYDNGILYIRNLAGYTTFKVNEGSSKLYAPVERNFVVKEYGSQEIDKEFFEKTNFSYGDFPGVDYNAYGFYF